ncbi:putative dsRNA-binding protein [Planobispora rosea]|uniref:putative dsRNA-binding protein n=1 Tax=Planobispora rosea TaxID=35762 RepID=UPI00083AF38A|nr:putative dsRNA-binding protein [Planobispora rosea]
MSRTDQQPPADEVPPSRRRGGLAAIRGDGQDNPRSFFCRVCHRCENGLWVPAGWYLLERAPGGKGRHIRLGLYCSVACLVRAGEMLQAGAAEHAARLGLPTEEQVRRERNRAVETAQTLLAGGMTVRQAADSLNVPTFTLKVWLKEAGVHLEPGPAPAPQKTAPTPQKTAPTPRATAPAPQEAVPASQGRRRAAVPPVIFTDASAPTAGAGPSSTQATASLAQIATPPAQITVPSPQAAPASAQSAVAPGRNPVSVLNEQAQKGLISTVTWETAVTGPAHAPSFTVTAATQPAGRPGPASATGTGPSKTAARTAAAAALLAVLGIT